MVRRFIQNLVFDTRLGRAFLGYVRRGFVRLERAYQLHRLVERPNQVRLGPFQGLVYPAGERSIWERRRLIGCYESCLHNTFNDFIRNQEGRYQRVIVVGCAEGYYAVGLARALPATSVVAIDIDPVALSLTEEMAIANRVAERLEVSDRNGYDHLIELRAEEKALVVCDCEGCEYSLFDENVVQNLTSSDLIIELHDPIESKGPEFSTEQGEQSVGGSDLAQRFSQTHDIQYITPTQNDPAEYPLGYLPADEAREFLFEQRSPGAAWLVLRSRALRH